MGPCGTALHHERVWGPPALHTISCWKEVRAFSEDAPEQPLPRLISSGIPGNVAPLYGTEKGPLNPNPSMISGESWRAGGVRGWALEQGRWRCSQVTQEAWCRQPRALYHHSGIRASPRTTARPQQLRGLVVTGELGMGSGPGCVAEVCWGSAEWHQPTVRAGLAWGEGKASQHFHLGTSLGYGVYASIILCFVTGNP